MRGFAVAAGGWDEEEPERAAPLRLLEPEATAEARAPHVAATAAVVQLGEHRVRAELDSDDEGLIIAW